MLGRAKARFASFEARIENARGRKEDFEDKCSLIKDASLASCMQFFVGTCGVHPPIEARGDILLGAEVLSPTSRYRAVNLIDPRAGGPSVFMQFCGLLSSF